jgi:hypothetical protein
MQAHVILSTTLLLEDGVFEMKTLTKEEAVSWVKAHNPRNYCGHQTVKVLGLEPSTSRDVCPGYFQALCLKPQGRLNFGQEYSVEEIEEIGVLFQLITRKGS